MGQQQSKEEKILAKARAMGRDRLAHLNPAMVKNAANCRHMVRVCTEDIKQIRSHKEFENKIAPVCETWEHGYDTEIEPSRRYWNKVGRNAFVQGEIENFRRSHNANFLSCDPFSKDRILRHAGYKNRHIRLRLS
jgi:hypothetical protein